MAAEINLARVFRQFPGLRSAIYENRRFIIIPAATVLGFVIFKEPLQDSLNRFHSALYTYFLGGINESLKPFREQMKADLQHENARDPHPHNDDTLRILEVGMGPGASLDYYPRNSRIIGLDCNPYFVEALKQLQDKYPNFVRVIQGQTENLKQITDESIDIVVSTLVLCSVSDLDKSLKEIKRVLVKGGKFYFFEHQACQISWNRYILQLIFNGLMRTILNGCNVSRRITEAIEKNGFEMTSVSHKLGFRTYIASSYACGYVTKR